MEKKNKKKWLSRILIMLLLIIILILTLHQCRYIKLPSDAPQRIIAGDLFPGQTDAQNGNLPSMTPEEILEQMQRLADASKFSFKINARPVFEDGNSKGTLEIENPNYNTYPMVVQVFLDDTGELIYDSGGIMPNQHIAKAKLTKVLKKGTYKATAYLNAYDPDTKVYKGKSAAELIITIKN